ncbi:type IV pilus assembly protein PilM [Psychromonas sp. CD1]|uniref:type IV pilus assembly protein PilM n=1 Tax=Psychromonas sp. CD1 TaxID=1979839 RepID=UPI000B9BE845|nr:type IV pilus assembly protein PilM [Psychromonas sp. CD1]
MFFSIKKNKANALIGLDFGSCSMKAILLSKHQGMLRIDASAEVPLDRNLIVDGHLEDIHQLSGAIKQLRKSLPRGYKKVAIAVTGTDVTSKILTINADLSGLDLESQIEMEAENSISFPLDEIFLDFEILEIDTDIDIDPKDIRFNQILLSIARRETVMSRVNCVEDAGLTTQIVDVESHALTRACELLISKEEMVQGVAVIDIGASKMMLNILHKGQVIFSRSRNHGGAVCTQMFIDHYDLTFDEAEKMKIERNWAEDCLPEVISPFVKLTAKNAIFDLRMFSNTLNHIHISKVIFTGGCLLMPELVTQLGAELDIKIEVADPFHNIQFKRKKDKIQLQKNGTKYITALGLALRGVG